MNNPSATETARKMIVENPDVFRDTTETHLALALGLIKYAYESALFLLTQKVERECNKSKIGMEMSQIDEP